MILPAGLSFHRISKLRIIQVEMEYTHVPVCEKHVKYSNLSQIKHDVRPSPDTLLDTLSVLQE